MIGFRIFLFCLHRLHKAIASNLHLETFYRSPHKPCCDNRLLLHSTHIAAEDDDVHRSSTRGRHRRSRSALRVRNLSQVFLSNILRGEIQKFVLVCTESLLRAICCASVIFPWMVLVCSSDEKIFSAAHKKCLGANRKPKKIFL
jgi:hypothetical protein